MMCTSQNENWMKDLTIYLLIQITKFLLLSLVLYDVYVELFEMKYIGNRTINLSPQVSLNGSFVSPRSYDLTMKTLRRAQLKSIKSNF